MVNNLPARQETWVPVPGSGRPLGKRNGYPLQYSCLENHRDRGAWAGLQFMGCKELDTTEHTWVYCGLGFIQLKPRVWIIHFKCQLQWSSRSSWEDVRGAPCSWLGTCGSLRLSAAAAGKGLVVSGSALDNHIYIRLPNTLIFFFFLRNCTPDYRKGGTEMYIEHIEKVVVSM